MRCGNLSNCCSRKGTIRVNDFSVAGALDREETQPGVILASRLGDGTFYALLGPLIFWIDRETGRLLLPAGIIGFTAHLTSHKLIKHLFKRHRPFVKIPGVHCLVKPPDEFSFPSGHSAAAFLMATLLSAFFPVITVPAFSIAMLIGFSRVYNGVHYPSDVLAGMVLGLLCAKLGLGIVL